MNKITRWRAGLKDANRREKDMTNGTFNQQFRLDSSRTIYKDDIEKDLSWRFKLLEDEGVNDGKLRVEREEVEGFKDKANFDESHEAINYRILDDFGNLQVPGDTTPYISAIRRANFGTDGIALGNYRGAHAIVSDAEGGLIHAFKDELVTVKRTGEDGLTEDDWELFDYVELSEFQGRLDGPLQRGVLFNDINMWCKTEDVSYQVTFLYEDTGQVLFVSDSDYNFEHGRGNLTRVGPVELTFPDDVAVQEGRPIVVNIRFKSPVLVGGGPITPPISTRNYLSAVHELTSQYEDGREWKVFFKYTGYTLTVNNLGELRKDLICTEQALASQHSGGEANYLILADGNILVDDFCEMILWTSEYEDQEIGESEWALIDLMHPEYNTIHLRNYELLAMDDGTALLIN